LWARIHLPNDPSLAGKTLELQIDMTVAYPSWRRDNTFATVQEQHSRTATLVLSRPGAGRDYLIVWWLSVIGGLVLFTTWCFLVGGLAWCFRHRALPSSTYSPDLPDEDEDVLPSRRDRSRSRSDKPDRGRDDSADEGRYQR
jgi:hypothetical protein